VVRWLLEAGASKAAKDAAGKTPADTAREHGHTAVVGKLLAQVKVQGAK